MSLTGQCRKQLGKIDDQRIVSLCELRCQFQWSIRNRFDQTPVLGQHLAHEKR